MITMKCGSFFVAMLATAVAFSFTACDDDDEETVDPRDQAVGSYTGTLGFRYVEEDGTLHYLDEQIPDQAHEFSVAKNGSMGLLIDGEIACNNVKQVSNGLVFDIVAGNDGDGHNFTGYDYASVTDADGSVSGQHGLYLSSTKKFSFAIQMTFEDVLDIAFGDEPESEQEAIDAFILAFAIEEAGVGDTPIIMVFDGTKK